jgi:hypothetical protein
MSTRIFQKGEKQKEKVVIIVYFERYGIGVFLVSSRLDALANA